MTFATLVLIGVVALLGPLLAYPQRLRIPVVVGELIGGVIIGSSGFGWVNPGDPTFKFLANLGFGLTMFVAGSHLPLRNAQLRPVLLNGLLRALAVGVAAAILGVVLALVFHTGNAAIYGVLMASSSAALIVPTSQEIGLGGPKVLAALAQVAIADTVCIIALPLVTDPANALGAGIGALIIGAISVLIYFGLRWLEKHGHLKRIRNSSKRHHSALELRASLVIVFGLGAIAVGTHVSVMLAGFACGIAVAAAGEPKRLARQLFAINDGFLGPIFFAWLGASLELRPLGAHPELILLGIALGLGAILAHLVTRLFRQPASLGLMSAAQLGVPVAAATVGAQSGILTAGEPAALILGALVTIAGLAIGAAIAGRSDLVVAPPLDLPVPDPALASPTPTLPVPPVAGETAPGGGTS